MKRVQINPSVRAAVIDRDGGRCCICGNDGKIHIDHVIPVSKGGDNDPENLRVLCQRHNLEKGDLEFHPCEGAPWDSGYQGADLTNSFIAWNMDTDGDGGAMKVFPQGHHAPGYMFTWGSCDFHIAELSLRLRQIKLAHRFVEFVAVYRVSPAKVVRALAELAEFRYGLDLKQGWRDGEMWRLGLPCDKERFL